MAGDDSDLNAGDEALDAAFIEDGVVDDAAVEGEAIIDEMDQVRGQLGNGIDRLGEEMKHVFDWQAYVRSAPLTSVGIAVAVGYLFAPSLRSRPVVQVVPGPTSEPQTASQGATSQGGGIFSYLASTAFAAVARIATAYVTDLLITPASDTTASNERSRPSRTGSSQSDPTPDLGL